MICVRIIIQHIYYIVYLSHIVGHQNKKHRKSSLVQRSGRNSRSWSFSNINEEYENIYIYIYIIYIYIYTLCNQMIGKPNIR